MLGIAGITVGTVFIGMNILAGKKKTVLYMRMSQIRKTH